MNRSRLASSLLAAALLVLVSCAAPAQATIYYVKPTGNDGSNGLSWGTAKATVQGAVDVASSGSEVWVAAGTYDDDVTLAPGVSLYGGFQGVETSRDERNARANETIIQPTSGLRVVYATAGVGTNTVVNGFTIANRSMGVRCYGGSPTISNNVITDNVVGVYCDTSAAPVIKDNVIASNGGNTGCGIVVTSGSNPTIANNTIAENLDSSYTRGGVDVSDASATIVNNIIALNTAGITKSGTGTATLSYNCVYNNITGNYDGVSPGTGDIGDDPEFVSTLSDNYHLCPNSPCISAGTATPVGPDDRDIDNQPRIMGPDVDMGADERKGPRCDFDGDGEDDLVGLSSNGSIWYTTSKSSWTGLSGTLETLTVGDYDGNGESDIGGLTSDGRIYYTTNLAGWTRVDGSLGQIASGDFDGDGEDDLVGLSGSGSIWATTDKDTWDQVAGALSSLMSGNYAGSYYDGFAGLSASGGIWVYDFQDQHWDNMSGTLDSMVCGDPNADGLYSPAGMGSDGRLWYNRDGGGSWNYIPGSLDVMKLGDMNGNGTDDVVGLNAAGAVWWYNVDTHEWTNVPGALSALVVGDFDGDGEDDIAGLAAGGKIWYTTNKTNWTNIPGALSKLYSAR